MKRRFPVTLAPMLRTEFASSDTELQAGEQRLGRSFSVELKELLAWSDGASANESHSLLHVCDEWDLMGLHDIVDDVLYEEENGWSSHWEPFLSSSFGFVCLDWSHQGVVVEVDSDCKLGEALAPNLVTFLERWIQALEKLSEDDIDTELRELPLDFLS